MSFTQRSVLDATIASTTMAGTPGILSTTALPGFNDYSGSYINGTTDRIIMPDGAGRAIPSYALTHKTANQRLDVDFINDAAKNQRWRVAFRQDMTGGSFENGGLEIYIGLANKIFCYGWTSDSSGANGLPGASVSPSMGLIADHIYRLQSEITGTGTAPLFTFTLWDVTSGTPVAVNFNSGSNIWTFQAADGVYCHQADGTGFPCLLGDNSDYSRVAYYDDLVVSPDLVLPEPVVSDITSSSAVLTASPSGGVPPYHHAWQKREDVAEGDWLSVGLPDDAIVNPTGLDAGSGHNFRDIVTDSSDPVQTQVNGVIFNTLAGSEYIDCYFDWVFNPEGEVLITAHPSGGVAPYTYEWSKSGHMYDAGITLNPSTINSQTVKIIATDPDNYHPLNVIISDSTGKNWILNSQSKPSFIYPPKVWLNHTNVVLRPTGEDIAIPVGTKFAQGGDSNTQGGSPPSIVTMAATVSALKGVDVSGIVVNSGYGSSSQTFYDNRVSMVEYLDQENVTHLFLRLGYNDGFSVSETVQLVSDTADYVLVNSNSVIQIGIFPTFARAGSPWDVGDGTTRMRDLQTGFSELHNGTTVIFFSTDDYDYTLADRSYLYQSPETTHLLNRGYTSVGQRNANNFLSQYPVVSNAPIVDLQANHTIQFTFPVPGTIAEQVVEWTVAKQGGGAAYGSVDETGLYTAPGSFTGEGIDIITATSVGGDIATVSVTLEQSGGESGESIMYFNPVGPHYSGSFAAGRNLDIETEDSANVLMLEPNLYALKYTLDGSTPTSEHGFTLSPGKIHTLQLGPEAVVRLYSASLATKIQYQWGTYDG